MDLSFLLQLINPIILGICLVVGYGLKTAFDKFPNKYIPLASLCLGTIIEYSSIYPLGSMLRLFWAV